MLVDHDWSWTLSALIICDAGIKQPKYDVKITVNATHTQSLTRSMCPNFILHTQFWLWTMFAAEKWHAGIFQNASKRHCRWWWWHTQRMQSWKVWLMWFPASTNQLLKITANMGHTVYWIGLQKRKENGYKNITKRNQCWRTEEWSTLSKFSNFWPIQPPSLLPPHILWLCNNVTLFPALLPAVKTHNYLVLGNLSQKTCTHKTTTCCFL